MLLKHENTVCKKNLCHVPVHQSVRQNHSRRHADGRPSSESIKKKLLMEILKYKVNSINADMKDWVR